MPSTAKGLPYPATTDPVYQGAAAIQALAEKLDAMIPYAIAAGQIGLSMGAADNTKTTVVTFPAGRFTQPPMVTVINAQGTAQLYATTLGVATATSVTLQLSHRDNSGSLGSAVAVQFQWHAIQMLATAGGG